MYAQPGGAALIAHLMTEVAGTLSAEGTAATRKPGTMEATSLGEEQGEVT
jgi:hypothetical protein